MWLILCISGILIPLIIGGAAAALETMADKKSEARSVGEMWLTGSMVLMGLAQAVHLYCLLGGKALWGEGLSGALVFQSLTISVTVISLALFLWKRQQWERKKGLPVGKLFLLVFTVQICMILGIPAARGAGDIMAETVSSFLAAGKVFAVNPLTGSPFTAGVSGREKVLGLPTFYALLCKTFHTDVLFLLEKIVPVFVLAGAYMAYGELGRQLFSGEKKQIRTFLSAMALILLFCPGLLCPGSGMKIWAFPVEGRDALNGMAYLGMGIRNLILLPYTLALSLRLREQIRSGRSCPVTILRILLCLATEVFICQTLYGLGYGVLILLLTLVVTFLMKKTGPSPDTEAAASEEGGLKA